MTGPLVLIRDRLVEDLRIHLPELQDVGSHHGRLSPLEVREISATSPALRIGSFGTVRTRILSETGRIVALPRFAAVFVVRSYDLLESSDLALDLAVRTAAFVADWVPGASDAERGREPIAGCGLPEDVSAEMADDDSLRTEGIVIWGCLFTVPLHTGSGLPDDADERWEITGVKASGADWLETAE